MPSASRTALTVADIGCWVIKSALPLDDVEPDWTASARRRVSRCLRASYRLSLMAPGQRCLLWLSGREQPGVHAIGRLSGEPSHGDQPSVDVDLWRLPSPVPREELLHAPALAAAEVLRMPAGSNPSYLSPPQLATVLDHLDRPTLTAAGWR